MSYCNQVVLKPSDVKFTCSKISAILDAVCLETVVSDIKNGDKSVKDLGIIEVVWYADKWEWYALNNQFLWVFRELEKAGNLCYVAMQRVKYVNDDAVTFPANLFDSVELDEVTVITPRSASVCSSSSEGRGKEKWGRKGTSSSEQSLPGSTKKRGYLKPTQSENEKGEGNVSGRDSKDARSCVMDWVQNRKKFCQLYSRDYNFQEYVAQNVTTDSMTLQPSMSLLSLNSELTTTSMSKITREQRQIDPLSGCNGYGHFDDYNKEYLSKLKEERNAAKRRLRPYDVSGSRYSSMRSRTSSVSSSSTLRPSSWSERQVVVKEERITRTYSETVDYRHNSRDQASSRNIASALNREPRSPRFDLRSNIRRGRSYSEGESCRDRGATRSSHSSRTESKASLSSSLSRSSLHKSFSSSRPLNYGKREKSNRSLRGSCSSLGSYGSTPKRDQNKLSRRCVHGSSSSLGSYKVSSKDDSKFAFRISSVPKEKLYELWQRRREAYLQARYGSSLSLVFCNNSLATTGYTCGLCFKSFKTRIRREQHSDELLHWACITCGRFFASHTALGQHVEQAGHRKD